jgi:hypothetical protein
MNLCRWVMLSPFRMFRSTHTESLVTFQNLLQYVINIYAPSCDNAVNLSSCSNLKKEICEKIYVFAQSSFNFVPLLQEYLEDYNRTFF